jgi:hypothetical protein
MVEQAEEYSSIGPLKHPNAPMNGRKKLHVSGRPIDVLVHENNLEPGLIKIDVEGAEMLVLKGAFATFRKYQPIVIAEMDDRLLSELGSCSSEMVELLIDAGYQVFDIATGMEIAANKKLFFIGNIVAVPLICANSK